MDLLTILKLFLFLGCVSYLLTIAGAVKRHLPKISIDRKKKKGIDINDSKEKD